MKLRRNYYENPKGPEERPFHNVIVDEVDNLLIDKSTQSAIMSTPSPTSHTFLLKSIYKVYSNNKEFNNSGQNKPLIND